MKLDRAMIVVVLAIAAALAWLYLDTHPVEQAPANQLTRFSTAQLERIKQMAETADGSVSFGDHFNALVPTKALSNAKAAPGFDPADDYWGLPRTEGVDMVAGLCSGCHSVRIIMQQTATEERWRYMLKWMVEKQGMYPLEPEEEAEIMPYLLRHFSNTSVGPAE